MSTPEMEADVGRNSKRKRDERRRREATRRSAQPSATPLQVVSLGEGREAEERTLIMVAEAYLTMPREPSCDGPVLIHQDGAIECHGAGCPGAMAIFHGDDAVAPCGYQAIPTRHACRRCVAVAESPSDIEFECSGTRIEHADGTYECRRGDACLDPEQLHPSFQSCGWQTPCRRESCTVPA
jgi:hypothetical protein